ncbi:MAG: ligase-associated DNA damage response exonuclease [Dokdonella sp.]|uniref:ligase-associated DNA damage response exonuclease n=1 Tax=Dokdonella sp. TaxID=2291710 RepID=UPI00326773A6
MALIDSDLVRPTDAGLFCPAGNFYIDPWKPSATAIITHAHGDHARNGSDLYVSAEVGLPLLQERLAGATIAGLAYGEQRRFGDATVSLHPAGHILGSAQVRIEVDGRVCVVSGDYKRNPDPTCAPFEVVPCDVFVTEATFAFPVYRWPSMDEVTREIVGWWDECAASGVPCVLFCYSLGKAQRLLAELALRIDRPVHVHGAMIALVERYRELGVRMLPTIPVSDSARGRDFAGELILAPPSAAGSTWMRRFGNASTGFASGWMRIRGNRRRRGYDRGFVVSDHADWPGLIDSIRATGARRVLPTHGNTDALVPYLRELGLDAEPLRTDFERED